MLSSKTYKEINQSKRSLKMNELQHAIIKTLINLEMINSHVYQCNNKLGFSLSSEEATSKKYLGFINDIDLESIISNCRTAEFYHHNYNHNALIKPCGYFQLIKNRIVTEIAGVLPFPYLKNSFYRSIGVKINQGIKGVPTIAPKVFIDYLNPELLSIGEGSIIGESAALQAHFFNPGKYVIGNISISEQAVIGSRAHLLPGAHVSRKAQVGVGSVINGIVPEGMKVEPNSYYKCL